MLKTIRWTTCALVLAIAAGTGHADGMREDTALDRIAACLHALPPQAGLLTITADCAGDDVRGLIGRQRAAVRAALGTPTWCAGRDDVIGEFSEERCAQARTWSYAFYRLPREQAGNGPALELVFGKHDAVRAASWVIHSDAGT